MKKSILIFCFLFSLQAQAFQCIVKLDSSSAELTDHSGNKINLSHTLKLKIIPDCTDLMVKAGNIKIYASNEEGEPQEIELAAGDILTERNIQTGEENEPPFVQIAQLLAGDPKIKNGLKRAFTEDEIHKILPDGEILHPAISWRIPVTPTQLKSTVLTILDAKNKSIVTTVSLDKEGVFTINGRVLNFNHHYQWILGGEKGYFHITSKQENKEIQQQINKIKKGTSVFMKKLITASIYLNNDLEYDARMVLNNEG